MDLATNTETPTLVSSAGPQGKPQMGRPEKLVVDVDEISELEYKLYNVF
jgi:hypothetical protein